VVPKSAVASVRTRIPTETDWSTSRSARESTRAFNVRGRGLPPARDSSSGRRQSAPRRMNETTRTAIQRMLPPVVYTTGVDVF